MKTSIDMISICIGMFIFQYIFLIIQLINFHVTSTLFTPNFNLDLICSGSLCGGFWTRGQDILLCVYVCVCPMDLSLVSRDITSSNVTFKDKCNTILLVP